MFKYRLKEEGYNIFVLVRFASTFSKIDLLYFRHKHIYIYESIIEIERVGEK